MQLSEKTRNKVQGGIDRLARQFADGTAVQSVARIMIEGDPKRPFMRWSMSNRMLAFLTTGSTDCRTFNQWLEVDRVVKKNAVRTTSTAYLLGPNMIPMKDDAGQPIKDDKGKIMRRFAGYHGFAVFSHEDTEGENLPLYDPTEPPALLGVAERWGVEVGYAPDGRAVGAMGRISGEGGKKITLFTHDAKTFWHELAHKAHMMVVKARGDKFKVGQDVDQEIVAEFSAAVLAEIYGHTDKHSQSYDYIARYAAEAGDSVGDALISTLGDVQKVLTMILTADERGSE